MNFIGIYICCNKNNKKNIPFGTCAQVCEEVKSKTFINEFACCIKYKIFLFKYSTEGTKELITSYENEIEFYNDFFPLTFEITLYKKINKRNLKNLYIYFFKKNKSKETEIKEEELYLNIEESLVAKINSKIVVYLYLIKSKHFLSCYYDEIKYSLDSLNKLYKNIYDFDINIDFDTEIDKISKLFKSLYEVYIKLNKTNNLNGYTKQILLENHHILIDEITKKIIETKENIKKLD